MSHKFVVISLLVLALIAGACAPADAPQVQVVKETVVVQGTPQVKEVVKEVVQTKEVVKQVVATPTPGAAGATPLPKGALTINGAGATFPDPVYTEWRFAYPFVDPSVTINYQAVGSGGGKKAIADKTVDFAGSDSLLTQAEYDKTPNLQMFPTLAGAVVPIYNIKEITSGLTLNGPVLADIYLGKVKKWNDPAIAKLNPDLRLPDRNITAVHRSDGSGTTEIFTKALAAFSDEWKNGPKAGQSVEWPVDKAGNGVGGKGNAGVAAAVQNTPDSIGYVELSYAAANKITFADMINKAGKKLTANAETLQAAMSDYAGAFSDKLTVDSISNGGGEKSWPIAGYTYMIIPMEMPADKTYGCAKPQKFLDFVYWALTDAAAGKRAGELGYATLPDTVRAKVFATLAKATCDGKAIDSMIAKAK
jgi:phosphate transport system substrate-binding protein